MELRCKRGGRETKEHYSVLVMVQKYYNQWFASLHDLIGWDEGEKKEELNKTRVLAKLVEKTGSSVRDVELKMGGEWGPQHVCVVKGLDELLGVHGEIEGM